MSSADTWAASQFYNLSQAAQPKMLLFRAFSSLTAASGEYISHTITGNFEEENYNTIQCSSTIFANPPKK